MLTKDPDLIIGPFGRVTAISVAVAIPSLVVWAPVMITTSQ